MPREAAPSPLRVGFAGCGRVSELHLKALARVEGVEAVAVMDVNWERAAAVAAWYGAARVRSDLAALIDDPNVDLVAVCTPPGEHAAVARVALEAGRHVLVEKPLVLDLDEADELMQAAPAHSVACVGFNLRVHRQVIAARRALDEGRLGRLLMVRSHWTAAPRPPGWRSRPGEGGGVLWEMGIHHLDLWRHLTGEAPGEVSATGDAEVIALNARTPRGTLLATTVASGSSDINEIELVGERGRMTLSLFRGDGPVWVPVGQASGAAVRVRAAARSAATLPRQARAARAGGDYLLSFVAEWEAVRDAVRDGSSPHATLADGRAAVALAVAAETSLRDGRPVEVPP